MHNFSSNSTEITKLSLSTSQQSLKNIMVSNYVKMNTMKEGSHKIMFSIEQIRMCTFTHPQVKLWKDVC